METTVEKKPNFFQKLIIKSVSSTTEDIKYRGPFSYRYLRIIAWLSLVLMQLITIDGIWGQVFNDGTSGFLSQFQYNFIHLFSEVAAPLFIIATFGTIINRKKTYREILIPYIVGAILIIFFFIAFLDRYLDGISRIVSIPKDDFYDLLSSFFGGKFKLNIFVDLLLCTYLDVAINYKPKTYFQGRKLIWFRLTALLPILYAIFSVLLKFWNAQGMIDLPLELYPFMTTKTPIYYFIFILIVIFLTTREKLMIKHGANSEQLMRYHNSNRNSLHFSIAVSIFFLLAYGVDFLCYLFLTSINGIDPWVFDASKNVIYSLGFGQSYGLLLAIPFIMLFSYTRTHKNTTIDAILPLIGITAIVLANVEGFYQIIITAATKKN